MSALLQKLQDTIRDSGLGIGMDEGDFSALVRDGGNRIRLLSSQISQISVLHRMLSLFVFASHRFLLFKHSFNTGGSLARGGTGDEGHR